jgi:hypothetical protein
MVLKQKLLQKLKQMSSMRRTNHSTVDVEQFCCDQHEEWIIYLKRLLQLHFALYGPVGNEQKILKYNL